MHHLDPPFAESEHLAGERQAEMRRQRRERGVTVHAAGRQPAVVAERGA